jgi:hypothetical protein
LVERRDEVIVTGGAQRRSRLVPRLIALAPTFFLAGACSRDIFDVDVDLATRAFSADFGAQGGTIPTVTCEPAVPDACGPGTIATVGTDGDVDVPLAVSVSVGCDGATGRCYAQADATVAYELSVLTENDFITKVERKAVTFVRMLDLAYAVRVNTLTFAVPRIDFFVGPAGARVATDPGVVPIDSIMDLAAGQTIAAEEGRSLTLGDQSEARSLIETNIRAREPFTLILQSSPRVEAGQPVPSGTIEVDLYPKVRVGLPR